MAKTLKIKLIGLRVFAHHGVFEFERANGQDFLVDATVWVSTDGLNLEDNVDNTVHYGELANALVENVKSHPVDLLETLAQRLLDIALNWGGENGPVSKAKITVHKPDAPIEHEFADVSVTLKAKRIKKELS